MSQEETLSVQLRNLLVSQHCYNYYSYNNLKLIFGFSHIIYMHQKKSIPDLKYFENLQDRYYYILQKNPERIDQSVKTNSIREMLGEKFNWVVTLGDIYP